MRIQKLFALVITLAAAALPATAQVPWDMVPTQQVAPEYQQTQYQSPANPASLAGYSLAAPNTNVMTPAAWAALTPAQQAEILAAEQAAAAAAVGNTTLPTNGFGVNVSRVANPTQPQNAGLNLPRTGTMGLAPVFGTGNPGFTSPGGYTPPMINIPGVGSYRIPQTIGLPGGGSIQVPTQQLLQQF